MKFGRRVTEESEGIQLAPLIDIVFLTLVFFMTTAVYSKMERELDVTLPTADSSVTTERTRGEIYINLKKDGSIVINDQSVTIDRLQRILNRVAENFPGGAIIIRGDKEAFLGRAIAVLNCCKKADIQNVFFETIPPETKTGKPS